VILRPDIPTALAARVRVSLILNKNLQNLAMNALATNVIDRCRSLGIELVPTVRGVKCLAPAGTMTKDLKAVIVAKRDEIRELLLQEASPDDLAAEIDFDTSEPIPPSPATWPADVGALADFVMLLSVQDLPTAPFELDSGRTVVDTSKFLRSLHGDVRCGADGPRAKLGSLQSDLQLVRNLLLDESSSICI
jgi:hypothetical protein